MKTWRMVKRPGLGAIAVGVMLTANGCTEADFLAIATALETDPAAASVSPVPAPPTATSAGTSTPGAVMTPNAAITPNAGTTPPSTIAPPTPPPTGGAVHRVVPKFTEAQFRGEPEVERLIIKYTNEARAAEGLSPLEEHRRLTVSARQHSQEMIDEGYYDHTSPHAAYARPSDRARLAGYTAGCSENIYKFRLVGDPDSLARQLVDGWLKSPGHRTNIMDAEATEMGAGVWRDGSWVMATQVFSDGQPYDFSDITLEDRGTAYMLRAIGKAGRHTRFRQARITVDGTTVGNELAFEAGGDLTIEATVPKGGLHTVGAKQIDPADIVNGRATRFWPTDLFKLDTSKPVTEAVL